MNFIVIDFRRRIAVISLLMLVSLPLFAQRQTTRQPIPRGTSTIRGTVIDSVTRAPVAGCSLEANGSGYWRTVTSGEDGAYALEDIVAGEYFFNLQCPAHVVKCLPDVAPATREEAALLNSCLINVARDQQRNDANFYVTPGAIARGRIVAFDGRPVAGATVDATIVLRRR